MIYVVYPQVLFVYFASLIVLNINQGITTLLGGLERRTSSKKRSPGPISTIELAESTEGQRLLTKIFCPASRYHRWINWIRDSGPFGLFDHREGNKAGTWTRFETREKIGRRCTEAEGKLYVHAVARKADENSRWIDAWKVEEIRYPGEGETLEERFRQAEKEGNGRRTGSIPLFQRSILLS